MAGVQVPPLLIEDTWARTRVMLALRKSAAAPEAAKPRTLRDWSEAVRIFNGAPMSIPHPLHAIYDEPAPTAAIMKAAQLGLSEYAINLALWTADSGRAGRGNALYILPGGANVGDFVQARVEPAITASTYLQSRVRPVGRVKEPDKVGLKRVGRGYVYFRTANAESGLVTVDADTLILDEHDRHPATTRGLAEHRLDSSDAPLTRFISTPTFPGTGIELEYLAGTRCRYLVTCPDCRTAQPLDWESNVTLVRGEDGHHSGEVVCRECREPMAEAIERAWLGDVPGAWLAENPAAPMASYHLSHLYRPGADMGAIADALTSSDINRVQNAWNQNLGLPFSPPGGQMSHEELARLCVAPFRMAEIAGVQGCYMGVDVGARMHVWVSWDGTVEGMSGRFLVAAIEVDSFDDVGALMRRFGVKVCVVDAHPELHAAGEFQMQHAGRVFLCTYVPERMPPLITGGDEPDPKRRFRVQVDRTAALDAVFGRLRSQVIHFPRDAESVPGLFAMLQAPVRRLVTSAAGKTVARYDEGSRPDHFAHSSVYAELAAHIGSLMAPTQSFDARRLVSLGDWEGR